MNNKVYCADCYSASVTVIGGATNGVRRTIRVGHGPIALCHNPARNRVYTADHLGSSISVIRDSMPGGIEETPNDELRMTSGPTIVRGVLHLRPSPFPLPVGEGQEVRGQSLLLEVGGRKVMDLQPGENDVRHLSPGVYFVRIAGGVAHSASGVRKVVVTRLGG